jgi:hypothetical protein
MTDQPTNQPQPAQTEQRGVDQVTQAVGDAAAGLPKEVVGSLAAHAVIAGVKRVYDSVKGSTRIPKP